MEGITEGGASSKTKGALQGAREALFGDDDDDDDDKKSSQLVEPKHFQVVDAPSQVE